MPREVIKYACMLHACAVIDLFSNLSFFFSPCAGAVRPDGTPAIRFTSSGLPVGT